VFAYSPEAAQCSRHTVMSALGSALAATAPPLPGDVWPEGGISPIGPFRFLSRSMLLFPGLPFTCPLAVCLRVSSSPPPVLIMLPIMLLILLHTTVDLGWCAELCWRERAIQARECALPWHAARPVCSSSCPSSWCSPCTSRTFALPSRHWLPNCVVRDQGGQRYKICSQEPPKPGARGRGEAGPAGGREGQRNQLGATGSEGLGTKQSAGISRIGGVKDPCTPGAGEPLPLPANISLRPSAIASANHVAHLSSEEKQAAQH
jgi:hypothetical protein